MKTPSTVVATCVISLFAASVAGAQPPPHQDRGPPPGAQGRFQGPGPSQGGPSQYYYNGRWVGQDEWQRHNGERDRWAQNYQRRNHKDKDDSTAIIAGILGFALGAAIVGSAQQADHARTADQSWDAYCAKKYRSYDRRSRTYLGSDGLRHYCQ